MTSPTGINKYLRACAAYEDINTPIKGFPSAFNQPNVISDDEETVISISKDQPSKATKSSSSSSEPPPSQTQLSSQQQQTPILIMDDQESIKDQESSNDQEESLMQAPISSQPSQQLKAHPEPLNLEEEIQDIRREKDQPTFMDEQQEYMYWHYKLNHPSQTVMLKLAQQGMLPPPITRILKKLDKYKRKAPLCNDCYCASASRTPWRIKSTPDSRRAEFRRTLLSPGEVVSIDQLESSTIRVLNSWIPRPNNRILNKKKNSWKHSLC